MAVEFAVSDWSGWTTPALASLCTSTALRVSEVPDASAIPAMLRRRLNTLGRAAAAEMLRHTERDADTPIVYSSRHGDIERTLSVLTELAQGEPVSPMNFSLAVHNAIPGILSIHSGITANITSIAALEESLVPVLLEAAGLIQEGCEQVLCLLADVPLPTLYRPACQQPAAPYAMSFIVSATLGRTLALKQSDQTPKHNDASTNTAALPVALQFMEFLDSDQRIFESSHNGERWIISRQPS